MKTIMIRYSLSIPILGLSVLCGSMGCYGDEYYYFYYGNHSLTVNCGQVISMGMPEQHKFMDKLDYHILPIGKSPSRYEYTLTVTDTCAASWVIQSETGNSQTYFFTGSPALQRQRVSGKNPAPEETCAFDWAVCGTPVTRKFIDFYGPADVGMTSSKGSESVTVRVPCRVTDSPTFEMHKPGIEAIYEFTGTLVHKYNMTTDPESANPL